MSASSVGQLGCQLAEVPESAGVYFLIAAAGELLYVGKAANLRSRLRAHARDRRWLQVAAVRCELARSEQAALVREADLLTALRPPWNKAHVDDYFMSVAVGSRGLTLSRDGAYGAFPHLGKGALTASGRACIDGFDALSRIVKLTSPDRALLHEFLVGRSSRLLGVPLDLDQPHVLHGVERDRRQAVGFYLHGPKALRELRLRHGGRGKVTREQFANWIRDEVADLLATPTCVPVRVAAH